MATTNPSTVSMRERNGRASAAVTLPSDPLEGVLEMGPAVSGAAMIALLVLAVLLHAGIAFGAVESAMFRPIADWNHEIRAALQMRLGLTYEVEVAKPPEPEPPPPPPPEEEKVEAKPEPAPTPKDAPPDEPPPPAAAQAGAVLTEDPKDDEPVDLTGNTFVTGSGSTYAGGTTQTGGTSQKAVRNVGASANGVAGGTGAPTAQAAPAVDRSRPARISNPANLERCPFPAEADAEQIDEAAVVLAVRVSADGKAESVDVTTDPGHGFGREAKRCALREKYETALDVAGTPIPGIYRVRFRFTR